MKRAISDFREGEEQERGVQNDIDSDLEKLKNDLQKRREQLKRKLEEQKSPFHFLVITFRNLFGHGQSKMS